MIEQRFQNANPLGTHRVLDPEPRLPQAADRLDPSLPLASNEVLLDVDFLQVDSASFKQLIETHPKDEDMRRSIQSIVADRGKMQNPVTGSGGMLLGTVKEIGPDYPDANLKVGDRVATLISLTATPLKLGKVEGIDRVKERVHLQDSHAVLFARSLYTVLPTDLEENVVLAAMDVCGAPLLAARQVKPGDAVLVLGLGKAGRSVVAQLDRDFADQIQIFGVDPFEEAVSFCQKNFSGTYCQVDAQSPLVVQQWIHEQTGHQGVDFAVNTVNVGDTEMSTILSVKDQGTCLFFGMATSFQKATLGAESVGKDLNLIMGTGYAEGHAENMLNLLRTSPAFYGFLKERFS